MDRAPNPANAAETLRAAWPRTTQLATAFLLGAAATLLGIQAWQSFGAASRPSELRSHHPIDLNRASRAELLQLPGVGPTLAERIERHRLQRGPFQQVEELLDVPGIGPVLLERLRPRVVIQHQPSEDRAVPVVGKIETPVTNALLDLNQATLEELQRLPGIGPVLSQRIVNERRKAPFRNVEDLLRVQGIGRKTLQKLRPLVCIRAEV